MKIDYSYIESLVKKWKLDQYKVVMYGGLFELAVEKKQVKHFQELFALAKSIQYVLGFLSDDVRVMKRQTMETSKV